MTVLVIGASGFLGKHLVAGFRNSGERAIGTKYSSTSDDGLFKVDLGVKGEFLKINDLVKQYKIKCVINLAASDVNPAKRKVQESGQSLVFFENLEAILRNNENLALLQIGTSHKANGEDSYFSAKFTLKNLLKKADVKNQIAVLDLPKIVGPSEPLGRFTSDIVYSLVMNKGKLVQYPCHKRNFMSIVDVVKLVIMIVEIWDLGGNQFPASKATVLSNYDVVQSIAGLSLQLNEKIMFAHTPELTKCGICPVSEEPLLVRPEFLDEKENNYFLIDEEQSVVDALRKQFEMASTLHQTALD